MSNDMKKVIEPFRLFALASQNHIRLVELLPGQEGSLVELRFRALDLNDVAAYPPFETVSFARGGYPSQQIVVCDGKRINVTDSLFTCLSTLRRRGTWRLLWIDYICINQNDAEEYARLMPRLPEIYSSSERTICWVESNLEPSTLNLVAHLQHFRQREAGGSSLVTASDLYHSDYKTSTCSLDTFSQDTRFGDLGAWSNFSRFLDDVYFHKYCSSSIVIRDLPAASFLIYHHRTWNMTDFIAAKSLIFETLDTELSWESLCCALEAAILCSSSIRLKSTGALTVLMGDYLRRSRNFPLAPHPDLLFQDYILAYQACQLSAIDPRDHVLGMLSTIQHTDIIESLPLPCDYSITQEEVFSKASQRLGKLCLSLALPSQHAGDKPSWVAEFGSLERKFLLNHPKAHFSSSPLVVDTSKTGKMSFSFPDPRTMQCDGVWVDRVKDLSSYLPQRRHSDHYDTTGANIAIFADWYQFMKDRMRQSALEDPILMQYGYTIQARGCNSIWEPSDPWSIDANGLSKKAGDFLRFLGGDDSEGDDSDEADDDEATEATLDIKFFYGACFPSHGRKLAITHRGYFCLVPKDTLSEDMVCVLDGSKVPHIFRPQEEDTDQVKNIGEAYVNGLMRGEVKDLEGCERMTFYIQ